VKPRYDEAKAPTSNGLHTVVGPKDTGTPLWIHQNAWITVARIPAGTTETYKRKADGNGLFTFIIEGAATINGTEAARRDSIGITDESTLELAATEDVYALVLDVPGV
jgi:redox-sensitive bicupin YhaK (pirin superfamily)